MITGIPRWLSGKETVCQEEDVGLRPGLGMATWRRKWQPIPVILPQNSMDRGARWATVHRVAKSQTQLSD